MAEFSCPNCGTDNPNDALYCSACGHPLHQAASDPLIGQTIGGRYYLVERIGQGSAGTLYRAEHTTLRRRVAIKLLHKQLTASEDAIERFRREAITVCEIDNDHIPQVHDFGRTDDGRLFFAMEFLDGETLSHVLVRESRLSPERTADLLGQIADGLMEAHTLGYVHRDLRPRSIFLTRRRGRQDFVKILDFGLAKLVQPEVDAQRTTMGMTYGDPRYMAPEQARGETVDRRSDIYSLGVIGFECLTGEPPYKGGGHFEILNQILDAPVPRLRDRRPDCPAWLESVVRTALAKKPSDRFQTVAQLLDALERKQVLQGQPPMPMQVAAPVASKLPAMSPLSTTLKPAPLAPAAKPAASSPAVQPVPLDPARSTQALPTVAPGTPAQAGGVAPVAAVPSARQTLAYPAVKPVRSAPVEPAPATRSTTPLGSSGFGEPAPAKKPAAVAAKPAIAKPAPIIAATTPVRADPTPRTARAILEREMNAWEEAALPVIGSDEPATPPSADTPVEEHRFEAKPAPAPAPVPAAGRIGGAARPASSRREISRIEARENRPISTPAIAAMRGLMSSPGLPPVGRSEPEVRSPSRPEPVAEPAPASPSEPSSPRLKALPTEDSGRATIPFERPSLSDLAVKVQASRQTPVPEQPPEKASDKAGDKAGDKASERRTERAERPDLDAQVPLRPALAGSPQLAQLSKQTAEIAADTQPVPRSEPGDVTVPTPRSEPHAADTAVTPKISAATGAITAPTATITGEHDSEKTPETPPDEANWFAAQAPTGDTYAEDEESLRPRRLPRWAVPAGLAAAAIGVVWLVASSTGTKKPHEVAPVPTAPTVTAPEPTAPSAPATPSAPPAAATPASTGAQPSAPTPSAPTVEALPGSPATSPTAPPRPEVTPLPATNTAARPSTPTEARPVPTVEALPSPARTEPAKPAEPPKPEVAKPEPPKPAPPKAEEPKPAVAKKTEEPKGEPKVGKKGKGKGEPGTKVATAKEPGDTGAGALKSLDEPAAGAKADKSSEVAALVTKGKQKLDDGDPDAAAASFERAAALDPKNADALGGLGEAAFEQGNFDAAARHLGRAAKLSRRATYRELLAQAQFKLGRYKDAAETCRGLLKDNPGSAKAKQLLELAEKKLGSE